MHEHIIKYTKKLIRDRTAVPDSIRFYVIDDMLITNREDDWTPVFARVFHGLNVTALLFARPSLPFADFLIARADPGVNRIMPKDTETKTFLHDVPIVRKAEWFGKKADDVAAILIAGLKERKAVVLEGLGVVTAGGLTVEQTFNVFSMIFHTTLIKYLLDLLHEGFKLPGEPEAFEEFKSAWVRTIRAQTLHFAPGLLSEPEQIIEEIHRVGRYTVEQGLVDSFFGNISYFDGKTIFISQTASSLDELEDHIDPVRLDASSTAGVTASSELPAHRAIYLSTGSRAVLHGHPKFSVILSMHCGEEDCGVEDCGRSCMRMRSAGGVPIVPGEIGAGGLARTVPQATSGSGACIVYGHGVFSTGKSGFREAFISMAEVENRCRDEYFRLLEKKITA